MLTYSRFLRTTLLRDIFEKVFKAFDSLCFHRNFVKLVLIWCLEGTLSSSEQGELFRGIIIRLLLLQITVRWQRLRVIRVGATVNIRYYNLRTLFIKSKPFHFGFLISFYRWKIRRCDFYCAWFLCLQELNPLYIWLYQNGHI